MPWSVRMAASLVICILLISPFQLMMDEFHLTEDDLKMIKRGKTSAAVETLGRLRERFRAVWVVTSTSCLLDRRSDIVDKVDLGPMMSGAGYHTVLLPNIMRTSRNIAEATAPSSWNSYSTVRSNNVSSSIATGSASTVAVLARKEALEEEPPRRSRRSLHSEGLWLTHAMWCSHQ